VETTPLQLARTIGGIAMGGIFKQPHLLKDAQNVGEERFTISEPTVEKITDAMYGVINDGGTGASLKLAGVELSGKSGTAQVIGYSTRDRVGKSKKFEDNAWFVGYAPRRNPEIVVAVLVQESGQHGGTASGPVVRDIIKAYYDKKNKNNGQTTVEYQHFNFENGTNPAQAALAVNNAQPAAPGKTDPAEAAAAVIPAPPAKALRP
jgi:penicillin-binding protein 2